MERLLPSGFAPARYGYWITAEGGILGIDQREGHIAFLLDRDEFDDLSPSQLYRDWYEAALGRGWVRVVAQAEDRRQFRFQFTSLTPAARHSLVRLITGMEAYGQYIFEAADYLIYDSREEAVQFVAQHDGTLSRLFKETWTVR